MASMLAAALAVGLWGSTTAAAAPRCSLPEMATDARPDPPGVATEVRLGVLVADVTAIDDIAQTIDLDLFVQLAWRDPRLAGLAGCRFHRTEVWYPYIELFNSNALRPRRTFAADQVEIGEDAQVLYFQRFTGEVSTYHELQRFPFDHHALTFRAGDLALTADELRIVPDTDFTTLASRLNIPDWDIDDARIAGESLHLAELDKTLSVATLTLEARRHSAYYVGKVLVPLTLIVLMS